MQIFLQFLGGACLAVIALAAIGYLWFRWQFKKMLKIANAMGGAAAPIKIKLVPDEDGEWAEADIVSERIRQFEGLGFTYVGTYCIDLVPDFRMVALAHPSEPAYATVAENPMIETFAEIVQVADDGRMLTVTTMKPLSDTPTPPHKTVIRLPQASVGDLFAEVRKSRLDGPLMDHTVENFVTVFEESYHRDMRWQYEEGGLRNANAREVEELTGVSIDPVTGEYLRSLHPEQWPEELGDRLKESFLKTTTLSASEWDRISQNMFFVHDNMDAEDISECVIYVTDGDDDFMEDYERLLGDNPRETYKNILTDLGVMDKVEYVGSVTEPVPADLYFVSST